MKRPISITNLKRRVETFKKSLESRGFECWMRVEHGGRVNWPELVSQSFIDFEAIKGPNRKMFMFCANGCFDELRTWKEMKSDALNELEGW